jgi:multiple sugar transport system ATP-binding protein
MGMIQLQHIDKIYPNNIQAVFDFNLEVQDGEFIVLVGPSGCGKSTVLRMVAGLEKISAGDFLLDGKRMNDRAPVERDISVVFQDYALYGHMTVYDNVGMSLRVRHKDSVEIYDQVMETSSFLGIEEMLNRFPNQLSGGQKQRVALGRSIARHPRAFLMDEPLSNLDAKLRSHTRSEIVRIQRALKVTTIYVTHDQVEAMTMADRMVVMRKGVIQQIGTPSEIYNNPTNMFVGGFIGSPPMNFVEGIIQGKEFLVGSQSFVLPPEKMEGLVPYDKKSVTLGIRPEHLHPCKDKGLNAFELPLTATEFLGNCRHAFLQLEGIALTAKIDREVACSGTEFCVAFDLAAAHFFDTETTNVII